MKKIHKSVLLLKARPNNSYFLLNVTVSKAPLGIMFLKTKKNDLGGVKGDIAPLHPLEPSPSVNAILRPLVGPNYFTVVYSYSF